VTTPLLGNILHNSIPVYLLLCVHYLLFYGHRNVMPRYIDENGHCACAVSRDL